MVGFLMTTDSTDLQIDDEFYFLNDQSQPEDFKCKYAGEVQFLDPQSNNRIVRLFWYSIEGHKKGFLAHHGRKVAKVSKEHGLEV